MVSNSAAVTPDKPEGWPLFFEQRLNALSLIGGSFGCDRAQERGQFADKGIDIG